MTAARARHRSRWASAAACLLSVSAAAAGGSAEGPGDVSFAAVRVAAQTRFEPVAYAALDGDQQRRYALGLAVFNTHWVAAGTAQAARIDGVGPLHNAPSCDACHNSGARGRGPEGDGALPIGLVIAVSPAGSAGPHPRYGHVLNPSGLDRVPAEAQLRVRYRMLEGRYPDGARWQLRDPRYLVEAPGYGALADDTVLKPRLAPALFGAGLLERVPVDWLRRREARNAERTDGVRGRIAWREFDGRKMPGRFDWQGDAVSVANQTGRAFAREMGLSNPLQPADDCTATQAACRKAASGGSPEVDPQLFAAVEAFQRWLAVPAVARDGGIEADGAALFTATGCADCHVPALPVEIDGAGPAQLPAYSDLLVHDLGSGLADRDLRGQAVPGAWRTAPLWGLGYAVQRGGALGLLHDGRARSVEEAILWHGGEAAAAQARFVASTPGQRALLLRWLETR